MKAARVLICLFVKKTNIQETDLLRLPFALKTLQGLEKREEQEPRSCERQELITEVVVVAVLVFALLVSFAFTDMEAFPVQKRHKDAFQMPLTPLSFASRAKVSPQLAPVVSSEVKEKADLTRSREVPLVQTSSSFRFRRGFLTKRRHPSTDSLVSGQGEDSLISVVDLKRQATPISDGNVSVVYKLKGKEGEAAAIFKPYELVLESSVNKENEKPVSKEDGLILSSKKQCLNEVIAYQFDQLMPSSERAQVPETKHVKIPGQTFASERISASRSNGNDYVRGSLQRFVQGEGCDDYGPSLFPLNDVHRIGVLDLRILNCDRHSGNILYNPSGKQLTPIDHALSFPEIELRNREKSVSASPGKSTSFSELQLKDVSFDWMMFPQAKIPFSELMLDAIQSIDMVAQLEMMSKMNMTTKQKLAAFASTTVLKTGAVNFKKTLYELGEIVQRTGARDTPSVLETLVEQALEGVEMIKLEKGDEDQVKLYCARFSALLNDYFKL